MRRFKRITSLFLTAALCVGMIPAVFAEDSNKAETIDLLFVCGQSNAVGWTDGDGNYGESKQQSRDRAVACDEENIFSTDIPLVASEANSITGLTFSDSATASNVTDFISDSVGSSTSLSGKTLTYKPNALSQSGTGKTGMDGAIAYEWNRLTGNDVWICNSAVNGVAMSTWVPGTGNGYYETTVAAMQDMIDVVKNDSHYELGHVVMFWMQGESNTYTEQATYYSQFSSMVQGFNSAISGINIGIILPRGMDNQNYNVVFADNGTKQALYQAANSYSYVYMASDVNKNWTDDSAVASYFTGKYGTGNMPYPIHSGGTLAVPTTYDQTFYDPHYRQVGHNENGLTAADTMVDVLDLYGHTYGEPVFEWNSDYTACTAVFTCAACGEVAEVQCGIQTVITTPAGCTTDGVRTITATAKDPETGEEYTDSVTEAIPATGHVFSGNESDLTWGWSDDHKSATASYVCEECHETVTVEATVTVAEPDCTCTTGGDRVYSATVEIGGEFYYAEYSEYVPELGHDLSATFEWSSDGSSCTAHITCSRGDVDETVECVIAKVSHTDATCTEDGTVTYVASIDYDDQVFTSDEMTFTGEKALGHSYGDPVFDWNGNNSCTAIFTCERGDDSFSLTCEISDIEKAATCTEAGEYTYTASVEYDGTAYSDSRTEAIAALGHDYRAKVTPATCGSDGFTTYTCMRCGNSYTTDYTNATGDHTWDKGEITTEPTCLDTGIKTYTCEVCRATKEEVLPALGHSYEGEITWSDDYQKADIAITCSRNNDYHAIYPCDVTYETTKEPTCENVGERQYTATFSGAEGDFSEIVTVKDLPATDHRYVYDLKSFTFIDKNGSTWQYGESDNNFAWEDGVSCVCTFVCENCGKEYTADCDVRTVSGYTQELRYATDFIVYVGDNRLLSVRTMDGHVVSVDLSPQTLSGADIGDMSAEEANKELGTVISIEATDNLDKGLTIEEAEIAGEAAGAGENGTGAGANGTVATEGAKTGDSAWLIAGLFVAGLAGAAETLNIVARKRREN